MDWSKAKTIIIIALLLTNIFLVFTYGDFGKKESSGAFDEQTLIILLGDRGVELGTGIPEKPKAMQLLSVAVIHVPEEEIQALRSSEGSAELFDVAGMLDDEVFGDIDTAHVKEAYVDRARNFITALGLMSDSVVFDSIASKSQDGVEVVVRFKTMADDFKVEESYMECIFSQGQLVDFESNWLNPEGYSRKKVSVMDPAVALLSLVSDGDVEKAAEGNVRVDSIELIYWLDSQTADIEQAVKDTAFPTWRITFNGDSVKYFNAAQL